MDKKLLKALAEAVLATLEGKGYWRTWSQEPNRRWKVDKPLPGLSVGDTVYGYYSDEESLTEEVVAHVREGIGYVFDYSDTYGPTLRGVGRDWHSATLEEAIRKNRPIMESDLKYLRDGVDRAHALEKALGEAV